jgi:hypothetical protein
MPTPVDKELYERAKAFIRIKYKKHSAFASGAAVKKYKAEFKKKYGDKEPYKDDGEERHLEKWFKEKWQDVGNKAYPTFRPTKRVDASTPLTPSEIDPKNLKEQINLKQKIKGKTNLPPFKAK